MGVVRHVLVHCAFVIGLGLVGTAANAQVTADVTRGVDWLRAQVHADGSIAGQASLIATDAQTRSEVVGTLAAVSGPASVPAALLDRLTAQADEPTEHLARRLVARSAASADTAALAIALATRQQLDGGFQPYAGFGSTVLDSLWAYQAMSRAGPFSTAAAARSYLLAQMQSDGGIGYGNEGQRVQAGALGVLALQYARGDLAATNASQQLVAWLVRTQQADGGWDGSSYLTAMALQALSVQGADAAVRANARAYLMARQAADGSWGGDAFLTAVVLRAVMVDPAATPQPSAIQGSVVDPVSGTPVAGAQVVLSGAANVTATSGDDGRFAVLGLSSGSYTLSFTKSGYAGTARSATLGYGQSLDLGVVAFSPTATAGIVKGRVVAAATGLPLAGASVVLAGVSSASTATDAAGNYEVAGVPAGAVTISISLSSFNTASGSGNVVAGQTLLFSPSLYDQGSTTTPTTGRLVGKVVAGGTGVALAGAVVELNGASAATTAADGRFDVTIAPQSYALRIAATGYDAVSGAFVLSAGAVIDVGTVTLSAQRTSTSISGRVTDQATGQPVAGAQVSVIDGGTTTSGFDGAYTLSDLAGTAFDIRVSASTYASQTWQLQVERPSLVTQDFALAAQPASSIDLVDLLASPQTVGAQAPVTLSAAAVNNGATAQDVVLILQVQDQSGQNVSTGAAFTADGANSLGGITLAPAERRAVQFKWNSGQFPPGAYRLIAHAVEAGSFSIDNPTGRVLATRAASLQITGTSRIIGSVTADPPVLRANTNTVVRLSALIQNDGNLELPAQVYRLQAVNEATGTVVSSSEVTGEALAASQLQTLAFADWVPTAGGNFRLEVSVPASPQQGTLVGKLYVGDAATASYTVDKAVVPPGHQTVRATVLVTGQDSATGTISDPLAVPIKTAIQKGVTYGDLQASNWAVNNRCLGCHVVTQALVGGELTRRLTTYNDLQRNTLFNALSTYRQSNGAIYASHPEYAGTQSMLGLWALNAWRKKDELAAGLAAAADFILGRQEAAGSWRADHASGWWAARPANTAFNLKSLTEVSEVLNRVPAPVAYTSQVLKSGGGVSGAYALTKNSAGQVIVANYTGGTVMAINPDGSSQTLMTGLGAPYGLLQLPDGALLVSTNAGIRKRLPDGTTSVFATAPGSAYGLLARGPDGNIYMSSAGNNTIYQITPAGAVTTYLSGSSLNGPTGLSFDAGGNLIIANYYGTNLMRVRPDKSTEIIVRWTNGNPRTVIPMGEGWLVGTTTGTYLYNADWQGDRIAFTQSEGLLVMADNTIVRGDGAATVSRLVPVTINAAAKIASYGTAIGKATNWLLNDGNMSQSSNLQLAHQLIGLGSAKKFYVGTALADTVNSKMVQVGNTLRSRQRTDGGWGNTTSNASDSLVTAQVGFALDYLNPSPTDPVVQNAIKFLLARQQADGSWISENGILSTRLAATTWVEIWLPIALDRIGGIDADVTLRFAPNVTLSNPSLAPTTTTSEADGSTSRKWQLTGVTSASRSIQFDLGLADMQLGESRPASADAFLTFRNSFTNDTVNAPIEIPRVAASAFLGLGVGTDRTEYGASAPVAITAQINNLGVEAAGGSVEFAIFALDGSAVASLGRLPFDAVAVGATAPVPTTWNTGTFQAGQYLVESKLYDSANRYVATARSALAIVPSDGVGALTLAGTIRTDKTSYAPTEAVRLTDRIANLALNQNAAGLRAETSLLNPDGSLRWSVTASLPEIVSGTSKDLNYSVPLNAAPAGSYGARLIVKNEAGAVVASDNKTFTVQSTAASGAGLAGTVQANPKQVPVGELASIAFNATNSGNDTLTALPLTLNIVDPLAQQVVASFPYSASIAAGASYGSNANWLAVGAVGSTYVAVLSAEVGGRTLVLAQDNFSLIEPPVRLALGPGVRHDARLLVLVSCRPGAPVNGNASPEDLSCVTARAQWLASYLASLGITHHISTTAEDFASEMVCGRYDTYWLSGGTEKLSATVAKEVREAVRRGAGLLIDGTHDERNGLIDEIPGVLYRGKLPQTGYTVDLAAPLFSAGSLTAAGTALKYDLAGGTSQGGFPADAGSPAVVTRDFGNGRGALFAFDLVGSLQAGGWTDVFRSGLTHVAPAQTSVYAGGAWVPLALSITNQAQPVTVIVTAQLPSGVVLDGTPVGASLDASGNPVWTIELAAAETRELQLAVRAPYASGLVSVTFSVATVRNGITRDYGSFAAGFTVQAADSVGPAVVAAIQALAPTTSPQRNARDRAAAAVQSALTLLTQGQYADAMAKLIGAADDLSQITSVPTTAPALDLARLVAQAEARQCNSLPSCTTTTPRLVSDGLFSAFAATERVQAQAGVFGSGDSNSWEWALGRDIGDTGARTTAEHGWVSGRSYGWRVGIDSAGNGSLSVTDGAATVFAINLPATTAARLRSGNAVQIGVRATREAGLAKLDASVTQLQGQSVFAGLGTLGDGDYSEAQLSWLLPSSTATTLDARGSVRLVFPDMTPPPGTALRFTVNAGTAQCRAP